MKKVLVILAAFAAISINGCQNSKSVNPEEVQKSTMGQERRIGVLQSLGGAYTSSQATHLLRMEDGKNLYLKSDTVDFNNEKYNNKEVEVMGEIMRTTDKVQLMTVTSIDVIDVEQNTEDSLPQWLDYNSDNLSLGFKYRDDYLVQESPNQITITKKPDTENTGLDGESDSQLPKTVNTADNGDQTQIQIEKLSEGLSGMTGSMGVASLDSADVLAGGFTRSKISQKAIEAYKKSLSGGGVEYFLMAGETSYKIGFSASFSEKNLVEQQNMFYDILASLDFTNTTSQSSDSEDSRSTESGGASGSTSNSTDEQTSLTGENIDVPVSEETSTETETEIPEESDTFSSGGSGGTISGFETFSSESQKFSIQYPKSYYFGSVGASSADAIRSYQFGSEPLEETSGEITLDIVKGTLPSGKNTEYNGVNMVMVNDGASTSVYTEYNGKIFRLTADKSKQGLLQQMAATLQ